MVKEYKNKWIKVKCHKCQNEQIMFGHAATEVKCLKCNEVLAVPTGGKAAIKAEILEILQ
ncbi:MAG: 30S ribosomal protein S27e [Nanoarchaeota archaeon]